MASRPIPKSASVPGALAGSRRSHVKVIAERGARAFSHGELGAGAPSLRVVKPGEVAPKDGAKAAGKLRGFGKSRSRSSQAGPRPKVLAYVALTKPRIIELLLVTTLPTMVVAKRGIPNVWLMIATLVGGALAAGGANAINMFVDRDIDALMKRTANRPLVTGEVTPPSALAFAITLEVVSFALLWATVNLLSAVLAVSATLFYVFVYTLWLKRSSTQNIVIGGAAGAVPVLVGWSAVTGTLGLAPVLLFLLIFLWTPPHFWALAVKYTEDYKAADVPMLPAVESLENTSNQIVAYTLVMALCSIVLVPFAHFGAIYAIAALVLGGWFIFSAFQLRQAKTPKAAMRTFHYSITYLTLLFVSMGVDVLVHIRL